MVLVYVICMLVFISVIYCKNCICSLCSICSKPRVW